VDPDDPTRTVKTGERGELLAKVPQVMSGYWKKPDATAEVFVDGSYRTGDIATIDEEASSRSSTG